MVEGARPSFSHREKVAPRLRGVRGGGAGGGDLDVQSGDVGTPSSVAFGDTFSLREKGYLAPPPSQLMPEGASYLASPTSFITAPRFSLLSCMKVANSSPAAQRMPKPRPDMNSLYSALL